MTSSLLGWAPAFILGVGTLVSGVNTQQIVPLREPLPAVVPAEFAGFVAEDIEISEAEQEVAGMSDYLMRVYTPEDGGTIGLFSVYVGYYENQTQGRTIHSPKNCLPGAGWEALTSSTAVITTAIGAATVNRYLLQNGDNRALVLYWYQGRGRIEANEYAVKWDLLRDSAFKGRSEEALVRVIMPIHESEQEAFERAVEVAERLVPAVDQALPVAA